MNPVRDDRRSHARASLLPALAACLVGCLSTQTDRPPDGGVDVASDGSREASGDGSSDGGDGGIDAGAPSLIALHVSASTPGDASPDVVLVPRFSPSVTDYYVRCSGETNALSVMAEAAPGDESVFLVPTKSTAKPMQTVSVDVKSGDAIVAAAVRGGRRVEYWVRCLPADFPEMRWVAHPEVGTPPPGYYLLGAMYLPKGVRGYAMVLDSHGVPVWFQQSPTFVQDVDSVIPGTVSYANPWQIHQLDPLETVPITAYATNPNDHDLRVLASGNYLVVWDATEVQDLTGFEIPSADGTLRVYGTNGRIVGCNILEVTPSGNVVWRWTASQHFDPVTAMTYKVPSLAHDTVDAFHCNSIDVDPATGNLLVSARHMDSVFYIERRTGKVLWKMGGTPSSKDLATFVPVDHPFFRQHDARLQPGWAERCDGAHGQVSMFDDETGRKGPARAVVYDVAVGRNDGGIEADCGGDGGGVESGATVAWQRKGEAVSDSTGSFRISPDGSRVIGWGQAEAAAGGRVFTEVDKEGRALIDSFWPEGSSSYRAIKVPLGAFDLGVLRRTSAQ